MAMKPIRVAIACPEDPNGTDFHRLLAPIWTMERDARLEVDRCQDITAITQRQLDALDVLIVSRHLTRIPDRMARAKAMIKASPCKLIVDVDDHWEFPPEHPGRPEWEHIGGKTAMLQTLKLADAIWCTTTALKRKIELLGNAAPVHVVPNRINRHDPQWAPACLKTPSADLRLGVICTPAHWMNIIELRDGLHRSNNVPFWKVRAIGVAPEHRAHVKFLLGTDRVEFAEWASPFDYAKHYRDIDLMLSPLMRNEFNLYRSPIKIIECSRTGTGIMAENYGPYAGAGQIEERGWLLLPDIINEYRRAALNIAPGNDPHLFSEKPDADRIQVITDIAGK